MKKLVVSIIIPVYKVSAYIERCVRSVMQQTYDGIECVLVDDASPDDSIAKCERMIAAYHGPIQFTIIHHVKNRGLSAARNTGTDAAKGDYIYYLDSDDELTYDCIAKLVKPIENDGAIEMVMGNYLRCADGCPINPSERSTLDLQETDVVSLEAVRDYYFTKGIWQSAWNKLIKRDFIRQHQLYFKEGLVWEDTLWLFFMVKSLCHFHIIPDVTYHYFKRPDALGTGMVEGRELVRHWGVVYDEIANHFTEGEKGREARYYLKGFCYRCVGHPDNQEFRRIARKYKKALWEEHCFPDLILLSTMVFLSKFQPGRKVFYSVTMKLRAIKNKPK